MILNVSGRCDIVTFYMEWFMNRYKEGYVDVRNPFYKKQISRIDFKYVDLIVFCTKNPIPLIPYLNQINIPIYLQVTVTGYHKDIQKNVLDKTEIIKAIQTFSTWALRVGIAAAGVSLIVGFILYAVVDVDRKAQVKQRIIQTMFGIVGIILAISIVNLIIDLF